MTIETAKTLSEFLKDSPLPQEAKNVGIMGALMGVEPDTIIKGMITITDQIETRNAESTNPKQPVKNDYTETEKRIVEMLTENTGVHMLDSGGAYGRAWERNRKIEDFRKLPSVRVEIDHRFNECSISYDTFHYLANFLELTDMAKRLQKRLIRFAESPKNKDAHWTSIMETFPQHIKAENKDTVNTYNYDTILAGTLQYTIFEYERIDYIILQIHGGCDVRGGYTDPQIFELGEYDYFVLAQTDVRRSCPCGFANGYSDDAGYHWYNDDYDIENAQLTNYIKLSKAKREALKEYEAEKRIKITEEDRCVCVVCKKDLTFGVTEGF